MSMRSVLTFVVIAALSLVAMPLAYAQPRLVTPPNATLVADSLIRLRWNPLSDASRYEIAIGWDSLFTLPTVQTLSATQNTIAIRRTSLPYVPAELTAFWRVRARLDSVNVGAWSEVWRFTMSVPKTVPPMVVNQIKDRIYLNKWGGVFLDVIELEPIVYDSAHFIAIGRTPVFNNLSQPISSVDSTSHNTGLNYTVQIESRYLIPSSYRLYRIDSTYNGFYPFGAQLHYLIPVSTSNTCLALMMTLIATNRLGWSTPTSFLIKPVILGDDIDLRKWRENYSNTKFQEPTGLFLELPGNQSSINFTFGQMPINQSTIASVPIQTGTTASSGWLSLRAVSGVEYSLSSTGTWQPSLRAEWRSGQPKLERLWLRYTPQAIGQNFPVIRYVANDSCDFRNHGLLRLEALATQPTSYAYTITSVRDAKALEPFLEAVYPNPTSSDVTFALSLSKASRVKLTVCTTLGSILQTVADASFPAGRHSMTWQSIGLPSGVYGYRLEVDGASVQSGFVSVVR